MYIGENKKNALLGEFCTKMQVTFYGNFLYFEHLQSEVGMWEFNLNGMKPKLTVSPAATQNLALLMLEFQPKLEAKALEREVLIMDLWHWRKVLTYSVAPGTP